MTAEPGTVPPAEKGVEYVGADAGGGPSPARWAAGAGGGAERPRTLDASVFPRVPGFFVAVPGHVIGEKAGDVILGGRARP
ncbi:hypothetical protein SUDANB176_01044 [Streptomyces sp. enrichment culture]|uniref:hypothetical protein n=1 Tax=Streptomyces sp. enrichment culture TaxID=1795815 RepID=UPI003F55AA5C